MRPSSSDRFRWLTIAVCAAAAACGGGSSTGSGDVASISVTGISQPLTVGATAQAAATATDANGAVLVRSFTWNSSNPAVATVASTGLVTGVSAGTATISASVAGKSGSLQVTVQSAPVATITVTGITTPLLVGSNGQAAATARDAGGTILNRTFTWTTSNAAVATVGTDGFVAAIAAGTATITASVEGKAATCRSR